MKHFVLLLLMAMSSIFATAQTTVSIHWPFNQNMNELVARDK